MLISDICTYGYAKQQQRSIGVPYTVNAIFCGENEMSSTDGIFFPKII